MISPFLIEESERMVATMSENFFGQGVSEMRSTGGQCITQVMPRARSSSATQKARGRDDALCTSLKV